MAFRPESAMTFKLVYMSVGISEDEVFPPGGTKESRGI
jgi:hypothetical protein